MLQQQTLQCQRSDSIHKQVQAVDEGGLNPDQRQWTWPSDPTWMVPSSDRAPSRRRRQHGPAYERRSNARSQGRVTGTDMYTGAASPSRHLSPRQTPGCRPVLLTVGRRHGREGLSQRGQLRRLRRTPLGRSTSMRKSRPCTSSPSRPAARSSAMSLSAREIGPTHTWLARLTSRTTAAASIRPRDYRVTSSRARE